MKKIYLLFSLCIFSCTSKINTKIPAGNFAPPVLQNTYGTCYFDTAVQLLLNTPQLIASLLSNKKYYKNTKFIAPFIEFIEEFFKHPRTASTKATAIQKKYDNLLKKYKVKAGGTAKIEIIDFIKELSDVAQKNPSKKLYHKVFAPTIRNPKVNASISAIYLTDDKTEYKKGREYVEECEYEGNGSLLLNALKRKTSFLKKPRGVIFAIRIFFDKEKATQKSPISLKDKNFSPFFHGTKSAIFSLIGLGIDTSVTHSPEKGICHEFSYIKSQYLPNNPWFRCDDNELRNYKEQKGPNMDTVGRHISVAVYKPRQKLDIQKELTKLSQDICALASKF